MKRAIGFVIVLAAGIGLWSLPAAADCKDEVEEVNDQIKEDRDEYTAEAIREACEHLIKARAHLRDHSLDCREDIFKARRALRQGKK